MPHVAVIDPIHPDGIQRLLDAPGITLDHPGAPGGPDLAARLRDAEALIVRGTVVDSALLAMAPKLRMVCRHGVGYDLVDVPAMTRAGVAVMITPEANAASVAEHALMLMLAVARQVIPVDAGVRAGQWRVQGQSRTFELGGRRVLVLGFGRIGTRVARLCAAFGMKVMVHDPFMPAGTIRGAGYEAVKDLAEGLAAADIVTLHLPASAATRGMVDAAFLAAMKPGAVLINTARGTLVDEAALEAALRSGQLGGAGLDVLRAEPMTQVPAMLALENLVVTPHVAASTAEGLQRMAWDAAGNVLDFLAGRPDRDAVINPEVLG
ncbi:D-3-phosphoglycerate dehydrogenase [Roseomonas rosea]|uniref:D-3-phosphoglycerate dehydrogenase n=1 Tax=Muricoccus roseus TaxID=198092 RepID=A0A1M6QK83_9PROT|nr:hydroxyacid dehydrogenase [Roseomonas rosea]SHK20684.1 D-3-phosphoglycerate dehydrogenase [Roseomonas rosea]